MARNPPDGYQRIIPYLYYADAGAALDWLSGAFGLRVTERVSGPDGQVVHAALTLDGNVVMLGAPADERGRGRSPRDMHHRHGCVMVYVDDVDAHHARAKAAGAEIFEEPADQAYGDRRYAARDPEGHDWYFATHLRDVPLEEDGAG